MIRPHVKVRVLNAPTPSAPPSQVPLPPVDPSSLQRLPLCQPSHLCHLRTSVSLTGPLKNTFAAFAQSCAKLAAPLEQLLVMSSDTLPRLRIVGRRRLALEQEALREGAKCIKHLALTRQLGHSRNRWAALAARVFFNAWDILFCASYPPSWLRLDFSNWSLKSSATWKNVTDWWYFQQSAIVSSVTKSSLLTYKTQILRSVHGWHPIGLDNQSTRQILSNLQISCFASKSARSALASNHVGFETMQQARHARQSSRRRTNSQLPQGGDMCVTMNPAWCYHVLLREHCLENQGLDRSCVWISP